MGSISRYSVATLGITSDQQECIRSDTHFQEVIQRLHSRMDLCDVVLIVGRSGKRIAAHGLILIGCSDYFSDLLSQPLSEIQQKELTFSGLDEGATEKLINYCYTGNLQIQGDTIEALLSTANHLRFEKVVQRCSEFIQRHIQPTNCLTVACLAEQLSLESLLSIARKIIYENFEAVSNQPDFLLLTIKQLSELIASDDLRVSTEELIFEAAIKWIEFEPETRKKNFTELLTMIRLPLLPPDFLTDRIEPLCTTVESKELLLRAFKSHLLGTSNQSTQPRNYRPTIVARHLLAIYLGETSEQGLNLHIFGYNIRTKSWTLCKGTVKCTKDFGVVLLDDELILMGGSINNSRTNTVTRLNLRTMISTEVASLETERFGHAVAVLNGAIYVIGGFCAKGSLNSVERWDSVSKKWSFVASMQTCRVLPGVAVINNQLYVSGGSEFSASSSAMFTSVECYDGNNWSPRASMNQKRATHCLVALNGYLFAIGGLNDKKRYVPIERYDPRTDTWTTIPCSTTIAGPTTSASIGSDIFIYNDNRIYMVCCKSSCDALELKQIALDSINTLEKYEKYFQLIALPYEFSPPLNSITSL